MNVIKKKSMYLTTSQWYKLNAAVRPIIEAFDSYPYLVGSASEAATFRDVDVRLILDDEKFDSLFSQRRGLWDLMCFSLSEYLRIATGLPIDFQIQRQTEANEKHKGLRNAIGLLSNHEFAGGGDATNFRAD